MNRFLRVSYSLVLGAWAALIAWAILDPLMSGIGVNLNEAHWRALADGGVVGLSVGAMIGALEKYNSAKRWEPTAQGCAIGLFIGMIGGIAGLLLANALYLNIELPEPYKQILLIVGWGIFGVAVGVAPGIAAWSMWKVAASGVGGCVGGIFGGVSLLMLASMLRLPWASRAAGFVALAIFVGALIALVQQAAKRATVKITQQQIATRPHEGDFYDIFKKKVAIGSGVNDDWRIPDDPNVLPRHVEIHQQGGKFVLQSMNQASPARVRNQPVQQYALNNGDRFWIGATEIAFKVG